MACMITNAFEIALLVENLRLWKTFKRFSKQQGGGGGGGKEVGPNYKVLPWNIDL